MQKSRRLFQIVQSAQRTLYRLPDRLDDEIDIRRAVTASAKIKLLRSVTIQHLNAETLLVVRNSGQGRHTPHLTDEGG